MESRKRESLPRAVRERLGSGRGGCRRCNGVGVVPRVCFTGVVYRPCVCVAGALSPRPRVRTASRLWAKRPKG